MVDDPGWGQRCLEWLTNPGALVVRLPPCPPQHYAKVRFTCQKIGHNPTQWMAPATTVKDPHQKPNRAICDQGSGLKHLETANSTQLN